MKDASVSAPNVLLSTTAALVTQDDAALINEGVADGPKGADANFYIGLSLAISSTIFIGASFIIKKIALRRLANAGRSASDGGYGYLYDWVWWCGLLSMSVGEGANFLAYTFAPATIVTPLGALSIIVSSMMGAYFLKERLNLHGKIGAILTILGSTVMVVSAPKEPEVKTLLDMEVAACRPIFLLYAVVAVAITLYLVFVVEPQHGRSNIFVYILICSIIGGFSVSCVKGVGVMVRQFVSSGDDHVNIFVEPFAYILVLSLLCSLTTQLNYLNRSLDVFDASMVTPIYYVIFTTSVLTCSTILFGEWDMLERPTDGVTLIAGFGVIIVGTFMLHSFKTLDITFRELQERLQAERRYSQGQSTTNSNENSTRYTRLAQIDTEHSEC